MEAVKRRQGFAARVRKQASLLKRMRQLEEEPSQCWCLLRPTTAPTKEQKGDLAVLETHTTVAASAP